MKHATYRQSRSARISSPTWRQALSPGQRRPRDRALTGSGSFFGLTLETGATTGRSPRVACQAASRPPAAPFPDAEGPLVGQAPARAPQGRLSYGALDLSPGSRGNSPALWGTLPSRPCLATVAGVGLEPPKARAPGPRAGRASHCPLAHPDVAAAK